MSLKFFGSGLKRFLYKGLIFETLYLSERGEFDGKIRNPSYRCTSRL